MSETNDLKKVLDSFYQYLFGVLKLHQEEIPYLKEELALIQAGNIEGLNSNLKVQQIFIYRIKNFDKEISGYMNQLGLSGKNLTEVVLQLPEEEQMRFYEIIGEFEIALKDLQFYKEKCQTMLQTNLHVVNKKIAGYALKKDKTTYSQDGTESQTSAFSKAFEKTI